ncbi:hypothetical protein ILUMI_04457 [Ignelater luminosus]|uniref:Uncharacterized protein n=1 Tax=Ignelater luminosus TaxID=2038154 RepID=A0A8K0DCJ7_IGNLU|nr:hypothetical protein ILUMI_04457 [Ignelater luminosus]
MTLTLVVYVLTAFILRSSFACNGYELKVNHIRNCNPNSIIKLQNFNLALNDNCDLVASGCVATTKPFQTAKAHYVISKPPFPTLEDDVDLCETLKNNAGDASMNQVMDLFQLPKQCPVNKNKVCGTPDKKYNIGKYKNRLALATGNLTVRTDVTHNNGVSCFDMSLTLQRARRG